MKLKSQFVVANVVMIAIMLALEIYSLVSVIWKDLQVEITVWPSAANAFVHLGCHFDRYVLFNE